MNAFRLADLCRWVYGENVDLPAAATADAAAVIRFLDAGFDAVDNLVFGAINTDSRSLQADQVFLALQGSRFDGHDYLTSAIRQGATLLVARPDHPQTQALLNRSACVSILSPEQKMMQKDAVWLLPVDDTLAAYQRIAAGYRRSLSARVIAITGSVGKTSTREMVGACLSSVLKVHLTKANLNNEIGLPATLLNTPDDSDVVVVEMGMRGPGEIDLLSRIARPDLAMITNIGWSHIERLGSRDAILQAKTEIVHGLAPGGWLVINDDDPILHQWRIDRSPRGRLAIIRSETGPDSNFNRPVLWASHVQIGESSTRFTLHARQGSWPIHLPVPGEHHVRNALFGFAAAMLLGIPMEKAIEGVTRYVNTGHRQRVVQAGSLRIMDDSYNAAPESMLAALHTMKRIAGNHRKLAILGSMLELGDFAGPLHFDTGAAAVHAGFDRLYLTGMYADEMMRGACSINPDMDVRIFLDQEELLTFLHDELLPHDHILIKGSRAYKLEEATAAIVRLQEETGL